MILFGCISDNFYGRFVGHLPNELTTRNSLQRIGLGVQAFVYLFKGKREVPCLPLNHASAHRLCAICFDSMKYQKRDPSAPTK